MNRTDESVLKLLQDIREMLLGIALVLFTIVLILLNWPLRNAPIDVEFLSWIVGTVLLVRRGLHIWNGWSAHRVVPKNDDSESAEP